MAVKQGRRFAVVAAAAALLLAGCSGGDPEPPEESTTAPADPPLVVASDFNDAEEGWRALIPKEAPFSVETSNDGDYLVYADGSIVHLISLSSGDEVWESQAVEGTPTHLRIEGGLVLVGQETDEGLRVDALDLGSGQIGDGDDVTPEDGQQAKFSDHSNTLVVEIAAGEESSYPVDSLVFQDGGLTSTAETHQTECDSGPCEVPAYAVDRFGDGTLLYAYRQEPGENCLVAGNTPRSMNDSYCAQGVYVKGGWDTQEFAPDAHPFATVVAATNTTAMIQWKGEDGLQYSAVYGDNGFKTEPITCGEGSDPINPVRPALQTGDDAGVGIAVGPFYASIPDPDNAQAVCLEDDLEGNAYRAITEDGARAFLGSPNSDPNPLTSPRGGWAVNAMSPDEDPTQIEENALVPVAFSSGYGIFIQADEGEQAIVAAYPLR